MARWKLCASTTFESLPLSTCTLCQQKSYISKVFTRFSKSLPQLEDVECGHLGKMFQVRRCFTFAMPRWKLCAWTTFEILPRSTCTLCQQKSYVSKGIYRIFEIFASARSFSGWAFGWKVSGAQVFCFCNGKVKTFRIDNIWNFATFNLFPVPAKILCLQRYSINFRNLWLSSKMLRVGILMERFRSAGILRLQWQRENFAHGQHLKFCHIQHVHCASKNPISPKVFTRFSKSLPQLEDVQVGHLGGKFQVRRYFILQWQDENFAHEKHLKFCHVQPVHCASKNHISPKVFNRFSKSLPHLEDVECGHLGEMFQLRRCFTFAMARWKLCAWTTFEILPLSTCRLWQQKSDISKGIQPIFEIFASARRCWGWKFVWNVLGSQVFYFWNGKVKAFRIDNIWNLSTFNLFPVPAKILYLQTLSTDFRNLCLSSKMLRWTFGWKVSGAQVFYFCNGKVKILRIDNIWNFDTFNLYTVPARILYLQRYSTDFRNVRISSKIFRDGIWVESFRCAGILLLQWQSENFAHRQHLKFCHFHPLHCARKNPISPKVFNRFWKSLPQLDDVEGGHLGGKLELRRYFTFAMQGENFAHLKFSHLQPVHCTSKNPMSPKVFNQFSKSSPQLEDVKGGNLRGKFWVRRYFTFATERWKLCASTTFESLPLSTCTLCQQKSYISNGIQPIFAIFDTGRRF